MNRKNILYFNIASDINNVSLGFVMDWIKEFSKSFESIDVISLNKSEINPLSRNVKVYGINKKNKLDKFLKIRKITRNLVSQKNYELSFFHMTPLLLITTWDILKKNNINSILWYTHPKPKSILDKLTLRLATLLSNQLVTASSSSFPYNSKKLKVVGHGINYENFFNIKNSLQNKNFLILSRISMSKNIEYSINEFLNSSFKNEMLTVIGSPLTKQDAIYFEKLKLEFCNNLNIKFKEKIPHNQLAEELQNYSFHINATEQGFYDKTVLETMAAGLINFYANQDYDQHFENVLTRFNPIKGGLTNCLNEIYKLEETELIKIIIYNQKSIKNESINSIVSRILN